MKSLPEIRKYNGIDTLFVKDEPFIVLSGEIHNSSASSLEFMKKNVWPNLQGLNMNTVIIPIYWELIEEKEGVFDYSILDGIVSQARENKMHLILLWFGLWKNSESSYVPAWIKRDVDTYFHARKVNGEAINTISPLCQAAIDKDANALAHIMAHLKEIDQEENTVIAIQVENEIGLLGTDRDYSKEAESEFAKHVPPEIEKEFSVSGSWKDCFGDEAGEYFMAYHFAKAVEYITKAAQKEYNLPCYANAWLKQYPWYAGSYPSGGPIISMYKMWKLMAPSLFCFAPDIYVPYVPQIMEEYSQKGNPLFIPEVRKDAVTASYALYAFGKYNAIGYSPFAVEELSMDPEDIDKPPMEVMIALNIDPSAFDIKGSKAYLSRVYELMENIKPLYFKYRGTSKLQSFVKKSEYDFGAFLHFQKYDMQIAYAPKQPYKPVAAGMIYEISENSFYIIGMMCSIKILPKPGENVKVEILKFEEGDFYKGEWKSRRRLNGDEKIALNLKDMPSCFYVEVYKF
ncbi:DUF5597 domain-containing protein [Clostridium sp. SYSU_GA19001]|uniref:DUF5597 domain-containing protein n=1 Tax=Clostridium caldaquaticum TaxID=2940653 RepID=UPI0020772739|nr:DUF5597 domain-containing protein [Clostridium caldaquaticum]MCM8709900.1 DUF5597 domain-containing protein [Clostridium caldaquaticum]